MMNIKCFIFSWKGQFENTLKLENQLRGLVDVTVINSDENNTKDHWITLDDSCYFSKQFQTALDEFDPEKYDVMWHLQSDASFDNWMPIINSAKESFDRYDCGVYAPNVDDTFYVSDKTDVFELDRTLRVVGTTDNTCWFIHKDCVADMKNNLQLMDHNILGWGWDLLICSFAHLRERYVIRDYEYTVNHPASSNYKHEQAEDEMMKMFEKCPDNLKEVIFYIKTNPRLIVKYYKQQSDIITIYDTRG